MKIDHKDYKIIEAKKYLKKDKFFLFYSGINIKSNKWINHTEQILKKINISYYKIFNKITQKTLKKSIYKNTKFIIKGITFIMKNTNNKKLLLKNNFLNNFNILFFNLIAIKINNKMYSTTTLKNIKVLKYKENKQLSHQFLKTNKKHFNKTFIKSK